MSQRLTTNPPHPFVSVIDHSIQDLLSSYSDSLRGTKSSDPPFSYALPAELLDSLRPPLFYSFLKRILDILFVLFSLPLVLPVILIIAVLIRLDSHGPVFFIQRRVGKSGVPFNMIKFRTMRHQTDADSPRFTADADDRTTLIGKFLRKVRLDELPQLWNVFIGEMSLIGPRPEQIPFVAQFAEEIPFYNYRHLIKPGITGWAQVNQGYVASTEGTRVKLIFDLCYIRRYSLLMDLQIVMKTIPTVLTGYGAK